MSANKSKSVESSVDEVSEEVCVGKLKKNLLLLKSGKIFLVRKSLASIFLVKLKCDLLNIVMQRFFTCDW